MQIQIASDLHCEHYKFIFEILAKFPVPDDSKEIDLYLAGDILRIGAFSTNEIFGIFSYFCCRYKHVFYTPGNHEFHGIERDKLQSLFKELEKSFSNLMILNNSRIFTYSRRVLGGTLWFPPVKGFEYKESTLDTGWIHRENLRLCNFLWNHIRTTDIIMTHHPPHWRSIPKVFRNKGKYGSTFGKFFMTELEHLILSKKPKLWIHGHSHVPVDYMLGQTRIISNPYGYPSENKHKKSFRQGIIEI